MNSDNLITNQHECGSVAHDATASASRNTAGQFESSAPTVPQASTVGGGTPLYIYGGTVAVTYNYYFCNHDQVASPSHHVQATSAAIQAHQVRTESHRSHFARTTDTNVLLQTPTDVTDVPLRLQFRPTSANRSPPCPPPPTTQDQPGTRITAETGASPLTKTSAIPTT